MCGRYQFSGEFMDPRAEAILDRMEEKYPGQYKLGEIFPGDPAPALIARGERILAVPGIFGFPGFQDGKLLINARAETAAEKRSFAEGLRERRVILPANGFFEWGRQPEKAKYFFTREARSLLYLCGIYTMAEGALRFVILTRPANASMIETHDRMPVIVEADQVRAYLTDREAAMAILAGEAPVLTRQRA